MKRVGCDPHAMTSKGASLKRRPSGRMQANVEECHDEIEEDDASSNTPRVCSQAKSRHTQGSKEREDMSVEDKLKEGWVGTRS